MTGNVNFYSETESSKLWVPDDTLAQDHYSFVKSKYGSELRFEFFDIYCGGQNCLTPVRTLLTRMTRNLQPHARNVS